MKALIGLQGYFVRTFRTLEWMKSSVRGRQHKRQAMLQYAVVESLESRLLMSVTWTGNAGDGNWNTGGNWSSNATPGSSADVVFNNPTAITITGPAGGVSVNSLSVNGSGAVAFQAFNITVSAGITLNANVTLQFSSSAANFTLNGGNLTLANGVILNADHTASVNFHGSNQAIAGSGSASIHLDNGTINNTNSSNVTIGSNITVEGSGTISGSKTVTNNGTINADISGSCLTISSPITNNGALNVNGGTVTLSSNWTNAGAIVINGGTLNLGGNFATSSLNLSGFSYTSGTVNLTGTLDNTNGTLALAPTTTGSWNLTGTISNGCISESGGAALIPTGGGTGATLDNVELLSNLTVPQGLALTIKHNLTLDSTLNVAGFLYFRDDLFFGNGSTQSIIAANGTNPQILLVGNSTVNGGIGINDTVILGSGLTLSGYGSVGAIDSSPPNFINNGNVSATTSSNLTFSLFLPMTNNGALQVSNGTLTINNGPILNANGSLTVNGGTATLAGNWTNAGAIAVGGGTLNLGGNFTTNSLSGLSYSSGTVNLTGTLDNTGGNLTLAPTTTGSWNLKGTIINGNITEAGATLTPSAASSPTLDNVTLESNLSIPNGVGLTVKHNLTLAGNITILDLGSLYFLDNASQSVSADGGTPGIMLGNSTANGSISINGTVILASGLTLSGFGGLSIFGSGSGNFVNNGTVSVTSSHLSFNVNVTNNGIFQTTNGTLSLTGGGIVNSVGSLNSSNSTVTLGGTWTNSGNISIDSQSTFNVDSSSSHFFTNNGAIQVSGNLSFVGNGTLAAGSSLTIAGGTSFQPIIKGEWSNAGSLLVGSGVVLDINAIGRNSNGSWGTDYSGNFTNNGTLSLSNGSLINIKSMFTNTGEVDIFGSSTIDAHTSIVRGSAAALSGTEVSFAWAGVDHASNATYQVELSANGTSFASIASPLSSVSDYLATGLRPSTNYSLQLIATSANGGHLVFTSSAVQTFNQQAMVGSYGLGSIIEGATTRYADHNTSVSNTTIGTSLSGWTANGTWYDTGSSIGAAIEALDSLVTDGSSPIFLSQIIPGTTSSSSSVSVPQLWLVDGGNIGVSNVITWNLGLYSQPTSVAITFTPLTWYANLRPLTPTNPTNVAAGLNAGNSTTGQTKDPIRYADGSVIYQATDLSSNALSTPFSQTRSWSNLGQFTTTAQKNGNGWIDTNLPSIGQVNGSGSIEVITSGTNVVTFNLNGGVYTPTSYVPDTLTHVGSTFVYTDTLGNTTVFSDFSSSTPGQFVSYTDAAGNSTVASTAGSGNITISRYAAGNTTPVESWVYSFNGSSDPNHGLLSSVEFHDSNGTLVRKTLYTYYQNGDANGNQGDLESAVVKDASNHTLSTDFYRYYTSDSPNGYKDGLKFVFGADAFASLSAASINPATALDTDIAPYADHYFEYDAEHRVTVHTIAGQGSNLNASNLSLNGLGTFKYQYMPQSGSASGANNWQYETIETQPDGSQNTVYCNSFGDVMAKVFTNAGNTSQQWITYYRYDSADQLILQADPSAVTGINPAHADLVDFGANSSLISSNTGLITTYEYYGVNNGSDGISPAIVGIGSDASNLTLAGAVTGYLKGEWIQHGASCGTPIQQSLYKYFGHTDSLNNATIYLPATYTVFQDDAGTQLDTTTYNYAFYPSSNSTYSNSLSCRTIIAPIVSNITQNGPGLADVSTTIFDHQGRPIWIKDPKGYLTYMEYDASTGALLKFIQDVDTANTTNFSNLPSGWSTPTGAGLNLITAYTVDALGRTTIVKDPNGNSTYYFYNDANHEFFTFAGYNANTTTYTLPPAQLIRTQVRYTYTVGNLTLGGIFTEVLTFTAAALSNGTPVDPGVSNSTAGVANSTIPNISGIQSLSRSFENTVGQVIETDNYYNVAGITYSNAPQFTDLPRYNATFYNYDARGIRYSVTDADGTIVDTIYDSLGRPVATYVGTNDAANGTPFTGAIRSGGNNMVQTEADEYDGGGVGDNTLTMVTQYSHSASGDQRNTIFDYDWRDRLISIKQGASLSNLTTTENDGTNRPLTINVLDNLGEVTATYHFDGDEIDMADTDGDGVPNTSSINLTTPGSDLVGYSNTQYDFQGRAFRKTVYSVDPSNGTISTDGIATDIWYDHNGNVIETHTTGGVFTKTTYDSLNRPTVVYTTDGGAVTLGSANFTWSSANSVSNDVVLTQTQSVYDADGNVIETITKDRDHNDSNLPGPLSVAALPDMPGTITIPSTASPTGSNLTLTWVPDVAAGDGNAYGGGYVSNISLSIDSSPTSGISVYILSPVTAGDYSIGFSGNSWAFVVKDATGDDFEGEYGNFSTSPVSFSNGTSSSPTPPAGWSNITSFTTGQYPAPSARVSYMSYYYDPANRLTDAVNMGTNGGYTYVRPATPDARSNTTLRTTTNYNVAGFVDSTVDPLGITTKYVYDALGQTLYVVNAYDSGTYTTIGNLPPIDTTGQNHNQVTAYTYDGDGHVLTMTALLPGGQASQTTIYDYGVSNGSAIASNDLLSKVTYGTVLFTASGANITIARTTSNGTTVQISDGVNTANLPLSALTSLTIVTGTGNETITIDQTNGDISLVDGLTIHGTGNVTLNINGGDWTFNTDEGTYAPNLTIEASNGANLTFNSAQNITGGVVGSNATLSNVTVTQWPNQEVFTYDALGETTSKTDRNGTTHNYAYDTLGRQTLDSVSQFGAGVDQTIKAIGTTYNGQGLVDTVTSYTSTTSLDAAHTDSQIKNVYNGLGQLTVQYQEHNGVANTTTSKSVQYGYGNISLGSRLSNMTYPTSEVINYNYGANGSLNNAIGRLDSISEKTANGTQTLETYQYLGLSTVVIRSQPQDGFQLSYVTEGYTASDGGDQYMGLDRFGRVVIQNWSGAGGTADYYTYTYDADGNVTAKTNLRDSAFDETYSYDALNQLANVTRNGIAYQSWSLDALGNMNSITNGNVTNNQTYNSQNELTDTGTVSLIYDRDGNTTTDDQGHTLVYDAWGRLVTVENSSNVTIEAYRYDGLGRRITETPSTGIAGISNDLYYSNQWQVLEEDTVANTSNLSLNLHADYIWSPVFVDALLFRDEHVGGSLDGNPFDQKDERVYALQDANYNTTSLVQYALPPADMDGARTVDLTDISDVLNNFGASAPIGTPLLGDVNGDGYVTLSDLSLVLDSFGSGTQWEVVQHYAYDPYGKTATPLNAFWNQTTDTLNWQYLFQGGRYDSLTSLYDFRNREYSPTMMRWMTQDPMGFVNGSNTYGFVEENPINRFDATGLAQAWYQGWGTTFMDAIGLGESSGNAAAVWGGVGSGFVQGVENVGIGTGKAVAQTTLQAVDAVNDVAAITTGHEIYSGNLSDLGQASVSSDFNYGQHVVNTLANTATFGISGEATTLIQLAKGQIDLDTASQALGASGLMQLGAAGMMKLTAPVNTEGGTIVGHGNWDGTSMTQVPEGTSVRVFTEPGQGIEQLAVEQIASGRVPPSMSPVAVYGPGDMMPNFNLGPDNFPTTVYPGPVTGEPGITTLGNVLQPNLGPINWGACTNIPGVPDMPALTPQPMPSPIAQWGPWLIPGVLGAKPIYRQ